MSLFYLNIRTFLELKKIQSTEIQTTQDKLLQRRKEVKLSQTSLIIAFGRFEIESDSAEI